MVVHRHTHKLPAHDQPAREVEVVPARFEAPGGVIVEEEHAARPIKQRQPKQLGPINRCLGTRAEGEFANGQETVAPIQTQKSENFAALPIGG